ncbi:MAG: L,D-transpeptidase family protein [Rhizobiaceae bacterium]
MINSEPAQARSLFEALFPRAAERRRARRERSRRREREFQIRERRRQYGTSTVKIKSPSFKQYVPTSLVAVKFGGLAGSFVDHEKKLQTEKAAEAAAPANKTVPAEETTAGLAIDTQEQNSVVETLSNDAPQTEAVPAVETAAAEQTTGGIETADPVQPTLVSQPVELEAAAEPEVSPVRLSAGSSHLSEIKLRARKPLGKALLDHYKANPSFIWINESGRISAKANAALRVLADAESYGLRIEDYALPLMRVGDDASEADLLRASMAFEFALSAAVLRYMADARNGYVDPNKISGYHDFGELDVNYKTLLKDVVASQDIGEQMLGQHPQDEVFEKLRRELADLRKTVVGYDSIIIPDGTFIRPGQTSDQLENIVESIRRKASLKLLSDHFDVFAVTHDEGVYSDGVVAMIRDFQKSKNLRPDGIVGKNTLAKMQTSDPNVRLNKVIYAMERLRWHPDQLGSTHVFINQPAYRASYVRNGKAKLSMRAVVGKPANQTSFFYDKIEYVEYNPYWGVPQSIIVNEMLPKLINNPYYLDNQGYEITTLRGTPISSGSVDWWSIGTKVPYNVRQPPGPKNALGELKIMFPNKHSIYMHDTPAKNLFQRDARAFSHGCVRLAQPRAMAAAVLGSDINQVESRLIGGLNNKQELNKEIPVYVAYFTAWPNDNGRVEFYGDVYGRDKALSKAMKMEADTRERARGVL